MLIIAKSSETGVWLEVVADDFGWFAVLVVTGFQQTFRGR